MSLNHDLDTRPENIRQHPLVCYLQCLLTILNHKRNSLGTIIMYNCAFLHIASNTYTLRHTGRTMLEFRHSHIIQGVCLRIYIHQIDHRPQDSDPSNKETERDALATASNRQSYRRLHDRTSISVARLPVQIND